jgi:hypothetical protein
LSQSTVVFWTIPAPSKEARATPFFPTGLCPPQGVRGALCQIGSISEERAGKGWFWALGVGTPFDPDKIKMRGSHVDSLDEAKRQFQTAWDKWLEWADLAERQQGGRSQLCSMTCA